MFEVHESLDEDTRVISGEQLKAGAARSPSSLQSCVGGQKQEAEGVMGCKCQS